MKKKLMGVIIALVFIITMATSCGYSSDSTDNVTEDINDESNTTEVNINEKEEIAKTPTPQTTVKKGVTESDFEVTVNNTSVKIGSDMNVNKITMGEPDDYSAAKSCMGAGEDKSFIYGDITIYTKPVDNMDKVFLIEIYGGYTLHSGITFGNTLEEVEAYYGKTDDTAGYEYFYTLGSKTIGIALDDNAVSFIEIFGED